MDKMDSIQMKDSFLNEGIYKISSSIKFSDRQESKLGLNFSVIYTNESESEIVIVNPVDLLIITVLDKDGKKVPIKESTPRSLVNAPKGAEISLPYGVESVIDNGLGRTVKFDAREEQVTLIKGASVTFKISISGTYNPAKNTTDVFASGAYKISLKSPLVQAGKNNGRIVEANFSVLLK
jgi:hypothetical protein